MFTDYLGGMEDSWQAHGYIYMLRVLAGIVCTVIMHISRDIKEMKSIIYAT